MFVLLIFRYYLIMCMVNIMGFTRVTKKGQVTIPKKLRDRLNIREGDLVEVSIKGDCIIIKKAVRPTDRLLGLAEELRIKYNLSSVDLVREMRVEDE